MATNSKPVKYVYQFGNKKADGNGSMKPLLGGKGANLAEMSRIGLPVPPGFTITTEVCTYYYDNKRTYPKALESQSKAGITFIEKIMGTKFGDTSAMLGGLPYQRLRDAVIAHLTVAEGLGPLLANVPSRSAQ